MKRVFSEKKAIIIAILFLAIGFAAISTTLFINGRTTIGTSSTGFDVYFSKSVLNGDDISSTSISTDGKKINFNKVEMTNIGDTNRLEYEVTNASRQYGADIEMSCTTDGDEYVSITNAFDYDYIEPRGTRKGTLTIKQVKESLTEKTYDISCEIEATARSLSEGDLNNGGNTGGSSGSGGGNGSGSGDVTQTPEEETFSLYGYFEDDEDQIIPNANLVVYSDTAKYVTTDKRGYLVVNGLELGTHEIYYMKDYELPEIKDMTKEQVKSNATAYANFTTSSKTFVFSNRFKIADVVVGETEEKKFEITLDYNDGTENTETKDATLNSEYGDLPEPEKNGYTFEGWYNDKGEKIDPDTLVASGDSQTLHAKWEANEYTVSFDVGGGELDDENITLKYDGEYGNLPTPEKPNCDFGGWYLDPEFTQKIEDNTTVQTADNHTIYAKWDEITPPEVEASSTSWSRDTVVITISTPGKIGSSSSNVKEYEYYITGNSDENVDKNTTKTGSSTDGTLEISEDGEYYIYYRTVSNQGNTSEWSEVIRVVVDKTAPTTTVPETSSTNTSITLTNKQTDALSGIETIIYGISEDGENYTWQNEPTFTDLTPGKTYYVKTKVIDKAGNESESVREEITLEKLDVTLSISKISEVIDFPEITSFDILENTSSGEVSLTVSDESVIDIIKNGNAVTVTPKKTGVASVTVSVAETATTKAAEKTYTVTIHEGTLDITANGYTGSYDGEAHSITVTSTGATITYSTDGDVYTSEKPTYTNVGEYTVYYKVERDNYTSVTDSLKVIITNATTASYEVAGDLSYTGEELTGVTGLNVTIINNKGVNAGDYVAEVTPNENYAWEDGTRNKKDIPWKIEKADNVIELSKAHSVLAYPEEDSVTITNNKSNGTISASINNNDVISATLSDNVISIKSKTTPGNAEITITSAETSNYKETSIIYNVTVSLGTLNVTSNGYTGTYDGEAHSVTVTSTGATITYSTDRDVYTSEKPTFIDAGEYTVYYKVEREGYSTVSDSLTVKINREKTATCTVTNHDYDGTVKTGVTGEHVNITGTYQSINAGTYQATCTPDNNHAWEDGTFNAIEESWQIAKINPQITADGYTGNYDKGAHSITVTSTGNTIKYGTTDGTYDLNTSPSYTNVGTYRVYYEVTPADTTNYNVVTGSEVVTINKSNPTVTNPTAKTNLRYNTSAQDLFNLGSVDGGTIYYGLGASTTSAPTDWATFVLQGTEADNYYLWIKVIADDNHNNIDPTYVTTIAISPVDVNVTANGYTGTYDGGAHSITVTSTGNTIKYGTTDGTYNLDASPTYTDAGEYIVYYQVIPADTKNYVAVTDSKVVSIAKADSTKTNPTAKSDLNYTSEAQALVNAGSASGGTLYYGLGASATAAPTSWTTTVPTGTNATTYYIWVKVDGDKNHNNIAASYVTSVSIRQSKAEDISYSTSYNSNVKNVKDAIEDLYTKLS